MLKKKPIIVTVAIVFLLVTIIFVLTDKKKTKPEETLLESGVEDEQVSESSNVSEKGDPNLNSENPIELDDAKSDKSNEEVREGAKNDKDKVDPKSKEVKKQDNTNDNIETDISKEGEDKKMTGSKVVLNSLPSKGYEVQDNTLTDTWGVVVVQAQLPKELNDAESYKLTIGDQVYDLTRNKYNAKVFSSQVSSIKHTKKDVEVGVITKN